MGFIAGGITIFIGILLIGGAIHDNLGLMLHEVTA